MLAGGHYAELIQLYKSNHKHREALLFLNRLAEHPESFAAPPRNPEQFGPKAIVDYLQVCFRLLKSHISYVFSNMFLV